MNEEEFVIKVPIELLEEFADSLSGQSYLMDKLKEGYNEKAIKRAVPKVEEIVF